MHITDHFLKIKFDMDVYHQKQEIKRRKQILLQRDLLKQIEINVSGL